MLAKIGLFAIGLEAYWPQFKGVKEELLGHHRRLAEKFAGREVVECGMVDNPECARQAGLKLRAADVDIAVCHLTTYSASENLLPVVRAIPDVPVLVVNVQAGKAMDLDTTREIGDWLGKGCTCAGFPEMPAVLNRFEHPFAVMTGHLAGDALFDAEMEQWCRAADAKRRLRDGNLGMFGRPYQGMMDLNVDETAVFRRFGCYVRHLNWEELADIVDAGVPPDLVQEGKKLATEAFEIPAAVDDGHMTSLGEVYAAAKLMAGRHKLIGMSNHCEVTPTGTLSRVIAASNPVFSLLTRQGIACPVEADLRTAIAMNILKCIGGSATLAELYSMDFNKDLCIIGHSGAADPDISDQKGVLKLTDVFHGKPGSGFLTQFFPAAGPVTLAGLTQNARQDFRLVVAEGEVVSGETMRLGDSNALFKFRRGLRDFANSWAGRGPTHHSTLGRGHHAQALVKAGLLLGIPVDVI